jgi:hypothetical protein
MLFLKSAVLREALVINDFLIIVNCLVGSRDRKLQLFEINEKMRVKTLPHVVSRVIKGIRIIYENVIFINEARVWRRLLFWPQRYLQKFTEFKFGTVAWMDAQPLKDLEKAVIHPYVMLSALQLIS